MYEYILQDISNALLWSIYFLWVFWLANSVVTVLLLLIIICGLGESVDTVYFRITSKDYRFTVFLCYVLYNLRQFIYDFVTQYVYKNISRY